jgi:hypothetical protein
MSGKNEDSATWRSDIMRRMAAVQAELYSLQRAEMSAEKYAARIRDLKQELAALMKKFLA